MLIYKNTIPKEYEPILNEVNIPQINYDDDFDILGIKGDNLQSMIALNSSLKNQIKLIYADVPYNTGNQDFIYNDVFNTNDSINYHSDWISWMLPRLIVSRELLTDDGVMVLSIDHNERLNLENLCHEVFGSENVKSLITVVSNRGGGGRRNTKDLVTTNEFLIVCTKNTNSWVRGNGVLNEEKKKDKKPRSVVAYNQKLVYQRRGQFFPFLVNKKTKDVSTIPKNEYDELHEFIKEVCKDYHGKNSKKIYDDSLHTQIKTYVSKIDEKYSKEYTVIFPIYDGKWGRWVPTYQTVLDKREPYDVLFMNENGVINFWEEEKTYRPMKTILDKPSYSNTNATESLKELYGDKNFDTPKSVILMRDIITEFTNDGDIILDWCAGSNSTFHGLVLADEIQSINRKYIFIQKEENGIDIFNDHSLKRVEIVLDSKNIEKKIIKCEIELLDLDYFYLSVDVNYDKDNYIHSIDLINTVYRNKTSKFNKIYEIF